MKIYQGAMTSICEMDKAITMQVIVTALTRRGKGTEESPIRVIQEIWTIEGEKIGEYDPVVGRVEQ